MGGIIFNIILLIIFSFFLKESFNIQSLREVDPLGAGGFPKYILILIVILLIISLLDTIKQYMRTKNEKEKKMPKDILIAFIGLIISIAVFIVILDYIGFVVSGILLTLALLLFLGERKKIRLALLTLFVPLIFTILFGQFLSVPLPRGLGLFQDISRIFY